MALLYYTWPKAKLAIGISVEAGEHKQNVA